MKKIITLFLLLTVTSGAFAQIKLPPFAENKLSASVGLGIPVTFFSVNSSFVGIYTGAIRYSYNKNLSFEAKLTANDFFATTNKTVSPLNVVTPGYADVDVVSYLTSVYGIHAVGYYNLHQFMELINHGESNFLPYANLGAGILYYKPSASYVNGYSSSATTFGQPARDYQIGIGTRYYLNSIIDLYGGTEYHFIESYWMDAAAADKKLDQYLNFYAGVSVKLGATPWGNLLDWTHKNIENPKDPKKNYANLAADGTLGIPYLFSPVGHAFSSMLGLGIRYSFSNFIGLQFNYNRGSFGGSQAVATTPTRGTGAPQNVKDYKTRINQFTLRAVFNIRNINSEPVSRVQWNHYASVGGGFIFGNQDVSYSDNSSTTDSKVYNKQGVQNIVVGYEARKYLTSSLDFIAGADYSLNQSRYFDGAYDKSSLNSHIYPHVGVTYKIGTSKDKEHIDWSYGSYNNFKDRSTHIEQVPIIEKPVVQEIPKIDTSYMVSTPVVSEPVIPTPPIIEEPKIEPKIEPVVVPPVVEPVRTHRPRYIPTPVVPQDIPRSTPRPRPYSRPSARPVTPSVSRPVLSNNEMAPPPAKYNVIVACYSINKVSVANAFKDKLKGMGFSPSIYHSTAYSKIIRMSVISTDNRSEALQALRRARKEVEPESWLYLYNKQ